MLDNKRTMFFLNIITYILLLFFSVVTVFPIIWIVISSFKPKTEIRSAIPSLFINRPTTQNFEKVLFDMGFLKFLGNSLLVASVVTLISLIISILAGYALSRYAKYKFVKMANVGMLVSQMIPGVLLLVPLYMIMQKLNILESYISLILAYITFVIPLCTFMMSSFFDTIPIELEEAAEMDGCNKLKTIFRVIIPVTIPCIISTGIYAFISAWNEFMYGYTFISTEKFRTVTPAIMLFKGSNMTDWGGLMATSALAIIPGTIIFLFLQKYFIAGMMNGSVKG